MKGCRKMTHIQYHVSIYPRLEPHTEWRGGYIADTDVLTLQEAARFASKHAETEITEGDFLRAAGRGQIALRAIVHRRTKVQKHDGGVYCNGGQPDENVIPEGSIPTLPLTACQHLAAAGRASWGTLDSFDFVDGELLRYTKARIVEGEPLFETVPADCRVTGNHVHALADAFLEPEQPATPAPVVAESAQGDEAWKEHARQKAGEIIKRQKAIDAYPSQEAIADEIARAFRQDGIVGAGGKPLTGAYIKRHALKGISSEQNKQLSTSIRRGK